MEEENEPKPSGWQLQAYRIEGITEEKTHLFKENKLCPWECAIVREGVEISIKQSIQTGCAQVSMPEEA